MTAIGHVASEYGLSGQLGGREFSISSYDISFYWDWLWAHTRVNCPPLPRIHMEELVAFRPLWTERELLVSEQILLSPDDAPAYDTSWSEGAGVARESYPKEEVV